MQKFYRSILARLTALCACAVFAAPLLGQASTQVSPQMEAARQRMRQEIETVKAESTEQSIERLGQLSYYREVGGATRVVLPLIEQDEMRSLNMIKSNRRLAKLLVELAAMPKTDAGKLVSTHLLQSLPIYQGLFRQALSDARASGRQTGPAVEVRDNPDGSPTPTGVRYKILTLPLIAGNLELADSEPAIRQIASAAIEQRGEMYKDDGSPLQMRVALLNRLGLYNRIILATAAKAWKPTLEFPIKQDQVARFDDVSLNAGLRTRDVASGGVSVRYATSVADAAIDVLYDVRKE